MLLKGFLAISCLYFVSAHDAFDRKFERSDLRIVNGEAINIDDVPYYVFLDIGGRASCGASIIARRWILGAAHCVMPGIAATDYKIRSGTSRKNNFGVVTSVSKVFVYPDYTNNENPINDFALFQLAKSLTFNSQTKPIKLPSSNFFTNDGSEVLAVGHGRTMNLTQNVEFLRGVVLEILSTDECRRLYDGTSTITDSMICTSTETKQDTCQGDSGGPLELIPDGILVGVTSFGEGCATPGNPGVYAKVAWAREWIKKVAKV